MKNRPFLAAVLLVVSGLSVVAAAGAADPVRPRSPRAQLVHDIVLKWGVEVQKTYRADVHAWARAMGPVFAGASLDSLGRAAKATSFDAMNDILLGPAQARKADPASAMAKTNATLASATKVLGDVANDLVFVPVTPCRLIDTRVAGGAIAGNTTRDFDVTQEASPITSYAGQGGSASNCGVGNAGAFAAAVINFTVVTPNGAGYITAYPTGTTQPLAATVNYTAGDIRGNLAIVKLDQGAGTNELSVYSFASTDLVADIVGYYIRPQATNLDCVSSVLQQNSIAANAVNFYNNSGTAACPAGYTATTVYCWTPDAGVYSQGSGYNANVAGNQTFCAWQNTTAGAKTVYGGNVCCRVPGR